MHRAIGRVPLPVLDRAALFIPTHKTMPSHQEAAIMSHKLMLRGGMLHRVAPGIYNILPYAQRALEKLERLVDDAMVSQGCLKMRAPALQPLSLWKTSERVDAIGAELMQLRDRHEHEYCLAPTAEEAFTHAVAKLLQTEKQLPLRLYQTEWKYRDEIRPRYGLLRAREFLMKDLYTFAVDEHGAMEDYRAIVGAYESIFAALEVDVVQCAASGGAMGGSHTHEFHVLADCGEDTLVRCGECGAAANEEVAAGVCAQCGAATASDAARVHGIEVAQAFYLGTRYSESFDAVVSQLDQRPLHMGCFGLGITRTLAALVEARHDQHGMCFPDAIAPYSCIVVAALPKDRLSTLHDNAHAASALRTLTARFGAGEVVLDTRAHLSFGERLNEALLLGFPHVVVVGRGLDDGVVDYARREGFDRFTDSSSVHVNDLERVLRNS